MEKLREEIKKATDPYAKAVGNYILSLNLAEVPEKKSLKGCMDAIIEKARKQAKNGVAAIEDSTVYGWAAEYFGRTAEPKAEPPKAQTPVTSNTALLDFDFEDLM